MIESLDSICNKHGADKGSLWHNYSHIYERFFGHLRDKPIHLLEIGTQAFCSIKVWLEYFTQAQIYGVDIWKGEPFVDDPRFHFFLGNQRDPELLLRIHREVPPPSIIIDDGSHNPEDVKISFDALWPHLAPNSWYVVEDVHCWFHPQWHQSGAGPKWVSELFGEVNWHSKSFHGNPTPAPFTLTYMENTIESVFCSKGLMIIQKRP